jgi:hypothetical protein
MLANGTLLQERYRIIRLLARGGMGAVYEAEAVHLGNATVAVKQTFYNEQQGGMQFLVMEFIPGADLFALLNQRKRPFDCGQVTAWAETLLDALDYIHLPHRWMLHPQPIGLDGEEIETGCELKGLPLRRTYG